VTNLCLLHGRSIGCYSRKPTRQKLCAAELCCWLIPQNLHTRAIDTRSRIWKLNHDILCISWIKRKPHDNSEFLIISSLGLKQKKTPQFSLTNPENKTDSWLYVFHPKSYVFCNPIFLLSTINEVMQTHATCNRARIWVENKRYEGIWEAECQAEMQEDK
jgi:hypothetical protein